MVTEIEARMEQSKAMRRRRQPHIAVPASKHRPEPSPDEWQEEQNRLQARAARLFVENRNRERAEAIADAQERRRTNRKTVSELIDGVAEVEALPDEIEELPDEPVQKIPARGPSRVNAEADTGQVPVKKVKKRAKMGKVEAARRRSRGETVDEVYK